MTIEGLQNYFGARVPLQLDARRYLKLLGVVLALVSASAVIVHLLTQSDSGMLATLIHAAAIGLVYVVGVALASTLLFALGATAQGVRVWHIWVVSAAAFWVGYYALPFEVLLSRVPGSTMIHHGEPMRFAQLLPIWFLVTYLFVQPYLSAGLKAELNRLRELNGLLEARDKKARAASREAVKFASGRTAFTLATSAIRNIVVEDHYCYVYFRGETGYSKRDLGMPLRDVLKLLPEGFVRVHRSHVVNLEHVSSVRRVGRNIRIVLDGDIEVPVSRHRLDAVMPALQQHHQ